MPTYDYECERCGTMEIFQSIKDATLTRCPECGSRKFQKLVSMGAGVIFKGAGFWETDYNRSASYQEEQRKDKPSSETSSAHSSTTQTSTPASTPAAPASESKQTTQDG